jgi:uncharacterized repeat protein (TIGR01451 family)
VTNVVSVSSPVHDPNPANNADRDDTKVPYADLSLSKALVGTITAGGTARYTLSVTNHGPSVAPGGITVRDTLPAGLTFESANGTGWTCSALDNTVTCHSSSPLAVDSTITFELTASVSRTARGSIVNSASMTVPGVDDGGVVDPNTTNDVSAAAATVIAAATARTGLASTGTGTAGIVVLAVSLMATGRVLTRRRRHTS